MELMDVFYAQEIGKKLDSIIGKYGHKCTYELMEAIDQSFYQSKENMINKYIRINLASLYGCKDQALDEPDHDMSEARSIAFHILNKKYDVSIRKICRMYDRAQPAVMNGIKTMDGALNLRKNNKELVEKYELIEKRLQTFITLAINVSNIKTNNTNDGKE